MRWIAVLLAATACGSSPAIPEQCDPPRGPPAHRFRDVTSESGVAFEYRSADFTGGALAVADLDGDGLPDIVAGSPLGGVSVFHNRGGLRFEPVESGIDPALAIAGIVAADLDNDGDVDLVLAGVGSAVVMRNHGDGTFEQAAQLADTGNTQHVLAVDLDNDGLLDLYLGNHDLSIQANTVNRLFMNRGNLQFAFAGQIGNGQTWSTTAFDLDGDGDLDLYVANDTLVADFGGPPVDPGDVGPVDLVLRNDGLGSDGFPILTDISADVGLQQPRSSMGGVLGDLDGDGRLDLYVPNLGAKKAFLRDATGNFVESAAVLGLQAIGRDTPECGPAPTTEACLLITWSAVQADFDLDGLDELLVVNGETTTGVTAPVLLFTQHADQPYTELESEIECMDGRAVVATDLDGDGDPDVVIAEQSGPLVVYENRGKPEPSRWLRVVLHGSASNRDGAGAIVTAHLASGRVRTRAVGAGGVLNTSAPSEALFGLGTDAVDAVEVHWPSGRTSTVAQPTAGTTVVVEEP